MTYQRFEELPVWQAVIRLGLQIYELTENDGFKGRYSLRDQIERAAVSVSNNIAEGFERGTQQELLAFLYIARGSAGEVRSMLSLIEQMPPFCDLQSEICNLKGQAESISKQLGAWMRNLRNSGIKGERYLSEKARSATKAAADRRSFLEELKEELNQAAPDGHASGAKGKQS